MATFNRQQLSDLRGTARLVIDATVGITDVVERMHHTIQLGHGPLGASRAGNTGGLTGFVYRTVRGTTRLVGRGLDAGMAPVAAFLPATAPSPQRDAFVSVVNGIYGDHLERTGNPLAIRMGLRHRGRPIEAGQPGASTDVAGQLPGKRKVMIFIHGLCLNEGHWTRAGVNRSEALAAGLGHAPLYLRYNTGMPIASNGRELAGLLEDLLGRWPRNPEEITIVGHSMGGLIARSAVHQARAAGYEWPRRLRKLFFIGTPHHGAPLERGGGVLDYAMELSPYVAPFARIGKARSAGIMDLRHGSITGVDREFVPLPAGVSCYALAATLGRKPGRLSDRLTGDGLVPVDSALGRSKHPTRTLAFTDDRQWIGYEIGHTELLGHPEVYSQLHRWLKQ
jgi:pimeloyl-ACP methyl ester carboxylesterase